MMKASVAAVGLTAVLTAAASGQQNAPGAASRARSSKGDAILIPENTPHWYSEIDSAIAYLEVRFSVPTK